MIEKNIRLQPHHSRDLLVGRRSDGRRPGYQPPGHRDAPSRSTGGEDRGGGPQQTYEAGRSYTAPEPVARSAPNPYRGGEVIVHTPPKTEYITKKEPTTVAPITKRPTEMLDIAGDIKAQQKLQEDIQESQRTGAYAKELGLPSIKRDVIPSPIINPFEETEKAGKLVDLTDLGDDAKTRQVQLIQKKADLSWQNKSTREKEEQQEKWDAAESKIKLQKEGGFWKTLGSMALAMLVPVLLPAKVASAYKLYNTAKSASAFAKKIGLTDQDAVQYVKNNILKGKDLSSLVAGKENVIAKSISQFTGQGDDLSDIEGQQAKLKGLALAQMRVLQKKKGMEEYGGEKFTPKDQKFLDKLREMDKEEKVYSKPILTVAHGGRIDKPLTGRSRDI